MNDIKLPQLSASIVGASGGSPMRRLQPACYQFVGNVETKYHITTNRNTITIEINFDYIPSMKNGAHEKKTSPKCILMNWITSGIRYSYCHSVIVQNAFPPCRRGHSSRDRRPRSGRSPVRSARFVRFVLHVLLERWFVRPGSDVRGQL